MREVPSRQLTFCEFALFAKKPEPRLTARLGPAEVRGNGSPCQTAFLKSDEFGIFLWYEALWKRKISVSEPKRASALSLRDLLL
jgi:hypothetical protein